MGKINLFSDINRQPQSFIDHIDRLDCVVETTQGLCIEKDIVLTGIATSYYACMGTVLFMDKQGIDIIKLINTPDMLDYGFSLKDDKRPLFILSRSGESAETLRVVNTISPDRLLVGITENEESRLAKRSNYLYLFSANEESFTNTISFTLSLAYIFALSVGLGYKFSLQTREWVNQLSEAYETMIHTQNKAEDIAENIVKKSTILIDGQGYLSGIAKQAALDFQEMQFPAVPVTGGVFRHGTIELTTRPDVSALLFVPNDNKAQHRLRLINELYDNGTSVTAIISESLNLERPIAHIKVPDVAQELQPFLYALASQQIYAYVAQIKGLDKVEPQLVGKITTEE